MALLNNLKRRFDTGRCNRFQGQLSNPPKELHILLRSEIFQFVQSRQY